MRILIVSDTHRRDGNLREILHRMPQVDLLIHCGDMEGSEKLIEELGGCPVYMVAGNNDYFTKLPREREFLIGEYKVWLTHGHHYGVGMGTERIVEEGRARGVDIVMFGHTHRPLVEEAAKPGEVTLINPGSLSYPRQEGRKPSFVLMELDRRGRAHYHLGYL